LQEGIKIKIRVGNKEVEMVLSGKAEDVYSGRAIAEMMAKIEEVIEERIFSSLLKKSVSEKEKKKETLGGYLLNEILEGKRGGVKAKKAGEWIVRFLGQMQGEIIKRIYEGRMDKWTEEAEWPEQDKERVRGTQVHVLGGSVATKGEVGRRVVARAQEVLRQWRGDVEFKLMVIERESSNAGVLGAASFISNELIVEAMASDEERTKEVRGIDELERLLAILSGDHEGQKITAIQELQGTFDVEVSKLRSAREDALTSALNDESCNVCHEATATIAHLLRSSQDNAEVFSQEARAQVIVPIMRRMMDDEAEPAHRDLAKDTVRLMFELEGVSFDWMNEQEDRSTQKWFWDYMRLLKDDGAEAIAAGILRHKDLVYALEHGDTEEDKYLREQMEALMKAQYDKALSVGVYILAKYYEIYATTLLPEIYQSRNLLDTDQERYFESEGKERLEKAVESTEYAYLIKRPELKVEIASYKEEDIARIGSFVLYRYWESKNINIEAEHPLADSGDETRLTFAQEFIFPYSLVLTRSDINPLLRAAGHEFLSLLARREIDVISLHLAYLLAEPSVHGFAADTDIQLRWLKASRQVKDEERVMAALLLSRSGERGLSFLNEENVFKFTNDPTMVEIGYALGREGNIELVQVLASQFLNHPNAKVRDRTKAGLAESAQKDRDFAKALPSQIHQHASGLAKRERDALLKDIQSSAEGEAMFPSLMLFITVYMFIVKLTALVGSIHPRIKEYKEKKNEQKRRREKSRKSTKSTNRAQKITASLAFWLSIGLIIASMVTPAAAGPALSSIMIHVEGVGEVPATSTFNTEMRRETEDILRDLIQRGYKPDSFSDLRHFGFDFANLNAVRWFLYKLQRLDDKENSYVRAFMSSVLRHSIRTPEDAEKVLGNLNTFFPERLICLFKLLKSHG